MRFVPSLAAAFLLRWPALSEAYCPPDAVCVDPAAIRTQIGLSRLALDADEDPDRVGYGVTLGYGTGLASMLIGQREGFAGHDETWMDLTLGGRASEALHYLSLKEGIFALSMDTGYVLTLGWNTSTWGLFAGSGIRYTTTFVGGSSDFEGSEPYAPIAARAQLRVGSLLFKTHLWTHIRGTSRGVRVDIPVSRVVWISGTWLHSSNPVALFSSDNGVYAARGGSTMTLSVRTSLMD